MQRARNPSNSRGEGQSEYLAEDLFAALSWLEDPRRNREAAAERNQEAGSASALSPSDEVREASWTVHTCMCVDNEC